MRGYGFVGADDDGEDVFLHASVFDGDPDELVPGIRIEFKVMAGDRGRKAFAARFLVLRRGPRTRWPALVPSFGERFNQEQKLSEERNFEDKSEPVSLKIV
jgi:cold shock CspA family protein